MFIEVVYYCFDIFDGQCIIFIENGDISIVEYYDMGQFIGEYCFYYDNGEFK